MSMSDSWMVADTKRANIEEMLSPRFLESRCASAISGAGMLKVSFAVFMSQFFVRAVASKSTRIPVERQSFHF